MSNLLSKYEALKAKTETVEAEKVAEVEKVAETEELAVIEKYASAADELLASEYGEDYNEKDVEKLATLMINHDIEDMEKQASADEDLEKIASLEEAGKIIALSFVETLKNLG